MSGCLKQAPILSILTSYILLHTIQFISWIFGCVVNCSSADIAATLGIPVMAVIDAGKMAQTVGAIA